MFDGPMLAEALKIPFTYCWSPALVPKPKDWGPHIGEVASSVQNLISMASLLLTVEYFRCLWILLS